MSEDGLHKFLDEKCRPARLLLVEDQEATRRLFMEYSKGFHCEWVMVDNAKAAIQAIDLEPFDYTFIDLNLAGYMSGLEVFRHVRRTSPEARVIIVSGYLDSRVLREVQKTGFAFLVEKTEALERSFFNQMFSALRIKRRHHENPDNHVADGDACWLLKHQHVNG